MSDPATPSSAFTLEHVSLVRDGRVIVDDISDHIHEGRATALVGPSGSGKTTASDAEPAGRAVEWVHQVPRHGCTKP